MKTERAPQLAALLIKWPQAVPAATAREVARKLSDHRLPATWALDQPSQIEALASWGAMRSGADAALNVTSPLSAGRPTAEDAAAGEISRRLVAMRASGMSVDVIYASGALTTGAWPRTLRALGVRGIVVDAARDDGAARALPFGVWQFAPQTAVPRKPRWTDWLRNKPAAFALRRDGSPSLATIDLGQVGSAAARPWRELDHTLAEAAAVRSSGQMQIVTVNDVTNRLSQANAARPQRSILRVAA